MRLPYMVVIGATLFALGCATVPTAGSPPEAGHRLVQTRCAGCHAVEASGASRRADAPPLRDLYKRYPIEGLRSAFLAGVHVGHRDMPTFKMQTHEVDAVLAYLKTIDPCVQPSSDQAAMDRCFSPL